MFYIIVVSDIVLHFLWYLLVSRTLFVNSFAKLSMNLEMWLMPTHYGIAWSCHWSMPFEPTIWHNS